MYMYLYICIYTYVFAHKHTFIYIHTIEYKIAPAPRKQAPHAQLSSQQLVRLQTAWAPPVPPLCHKALVLHA